MTSQPNGQVGADRHGLRVRALPKTLKAEPGGEVELTVSVFNSTSIIDGFDLVMVGFDQDCVKYEPSDISLFPGKEVDVDVRVTIPETYESGNHTLAVRITSMTNPTYVFSYREIPLIVESRPKPTMTIDPDSLTAGRRGRFAVTIRNAGGANLETNLTADDAENHFSFDFRSLPSTQRDDDERKSDSSQSEEESRKSDSNQTEDDARTSDPNKSRRLFGLLPHRRRKSAEGHLLVPPGTQKSAQLLVEGRRPLTGSPTTRLVTITATGSEEPLTREAIFVQRPWIPRAVITIAMIVGLLGLWAVIVGAAIDKILDDTDTDLAASISKGVDDVLDKIAPPDNISSTGGSATDIGGTGGPIPAGEAGVVRGHVTVLQASAPEKRVPIPGATVSAFPRDLSGEIDRERDPIVGITNDAGSFKLADMGRGQYYLMVSAPGYESAWIGKKPAFDPDEPIDDRLHATIPITVESFEGVDILDIPWSGTRRNVALVVAAGTVSGAVTTGDDNSDTKVELALVDESGLATDEQVKFTVTTGESGTFRFPCADAQGATCNAPLSDPNQLGPQPLKPGAYLLRISKPGFAPQQLTVEVAAGTSIPSIDVTLLAGTQAISVQGWVKGADGVGLAGVTVEVTGGSPIQTATTANGDFTFSTTPGVYNLVFSKEGYVSTGSQATVLGDGPNELEAITMQLETVSVSGQVVDENDNPVISAHVFLPTDSGQCPDGTQPNFLPPDESAMSGEGGFFLLEVQPGPQVICFVKDELTATKPLLVAPSQPADTGKIKLAP